MVYFGFISKPLLLHLVGFLLYHRDSVKFRPQWCGDHHRVLWLSAPKIKSVTCWKQTSWTVKIL